MAIGIDVTDLHKAQHAALQNARLAAIGQTVTVLSHESRNALQLHEHVRTFAAPIQLELMECSIQSVWRRAWDQLAGTRQCRDVSLIEDTRDASRVTIGAFRMEQVFRNFFENALAACCDAVQINIATAPALIEKQPAIAIHVYDNGPGLTAEQHDRLFEPFFTTKSSGTGLGLAIATRIVEAHGGTIVLASRPSESAKFVITIPTQR